MSSALQIAAQELRERTRLFLVAAGLATFPFLATLLPGSRGNSEDVIAVVGGFLAIAIGYGLAVATGVSTIGRELSEKRLSFWFAKPIGAASLWLGKMIAALVTSLVCFAVIAVPAALASPDAWNTRWLGDKFLLAIGAIGIVVLFFVSHTISTMVRSRSLLLGIDFVLAAIALATLFILMWPLLLAGVAKPMLIGVAIAAVLILAIAPIWQLANGRTDIRRSHIALSKFLWPAVGVLLLVTASIVGWLLWVSPKDLAQIVDIEQPAGGTAAFVSGIAPGRGGMVSTFIVDTKSDESARLLTPPYWGMAFSPNGLYAGWMQPTPLDLTGGAELHVRDVRAQRTIATGMRGGLNWDVVFSEDGSRVALAGGESLTVYEIPTRKILASTAGLDARARKLLFFANDDLVRVYQYQPRAKETIPVRIAELDVARKRFTATGETTSLATNDPVSVTADGSRMLVHSERRIADARTGATIATLAKVEGNAMSRAMLHDGSAAMVVRSTGGTTGATTLYAFAPDGALRHAIALPVRAAWISGERSDGTLILAGFDKVEEPFGGKGRTMLVVDLGRGAIVRSLPDTKGPTPAWSSDPRTIVYDVGTALLAVNKDGKLTTWK